MIFKGTFATFSIHCCTQAVQIIMISSLSNSVTLTPNITQLSLHSNHATQIEALIKKRHNPESSIAAKVMERLRKRKKLNNIVKKMYLTSKDIFEHKPPVEINLFQMTIDCKVDEMSTDVLSDSVSSSFSSSFCDSINVTTLVIDTKKKNLNSFNQAMSSQSVNLRRTRKRAKPLKSTAMLLRPNFLVKISVIKRKEY